MKTSTRALTAGLALLGAGLLAPLAQADTGIKTTFSGFGTLVGTMTDNDKVELISSPTQTKGAAKDFDLGMDSRLGLQGRVEFDPAWSVTGQLIAQRRTDKDFDPQVEWLFGQWSGVQGLDLRLGRVVLPAFLVSDSRFVSYALPGVRVPTMVYGLFPVSSVDGGQALYRQRTGAVNWTFTVSGGNGVRVSDTSENAHLLQASALAEFGDWALRYGYVQGATTLDVLPGMPEVRFREKFHNVAAQYDNGSVFATAEYVMRTTDPQVLNMSGWYVTAGTRLGKWTPYATVSHTSVAGDNEPIAYVMGFPVRLLTSANKAKGVAAGLRYDVATNVALKAEYGHYDGRSPFAFRPPAGGLLTEDHTVNTLSLGLDFVF